MSPLKYSVFSLSQTRTCRLELGSNSITSFSGTCAVNVVWTILYAQIWTYMWFADTNCQHFIAAVVLVCNKDTQMPPKKYLVTLHTWSVAVRNWAVNIKLSDTKTAGHRRLILSLGRGGGRRFRRWSMIQQALCLERCFINGTKNPCSQFPKSVGEPEESGSRWLTHCLNCNRRDLCKMPNMLHRQPQ